MVGIMEVIKREIIAKGIEILYKSELDSNRLIPDVSPSFNPEFDYEVLWLKH